MINVIALLATLVTAMVYSSYTYDEASQIPIGHPNRMTVEQWQPSSHRIIDSVTGPSAVHGSGDARRLLR